MIVDEAAINAGFAFRRYAMKPTRAKPRIIIAHGVTPRSNFWLRRFNGQIGRSASVWYLSIKEAAFESRAEEYRAMTTVVGRLMRHLPPVTMKKLKI